MTMIRTACIRVLAGVVIGFGLLAGSAAAQEIAAEFHGDWVPASGTCDAPARFRVEATRVFLINGKDTAAYGDLGIPTTFFGPDYQGISVVVMPEINTGNSPFTAYFNADEKKGVTKLEIYTEIKGGAPNAQVDAIQAAAKKLAQRFPLNQMPLKLCPVKKS